MACVSPPELDETTLLRYLDGEADQEIVRHLECCPHCQERARRLARSQTRLTNRLHRAACPSSLELGEYHLRALSRRQAAAVSRHLAECPHCSREVARLRGYLADLAPEIEASAVDRIKVLVAQLVSARDSLLEPPDRAALAPAYAAVRGEAGGPRLYRTGQAQIAISVQPDSPSPQRKVLGLITGIDARAWQVHLWRADERVADAAVDELGNFVVAGLAPAVYDLIISGPQTEIHIRELDMGAG